ncbi:MAG: toxin-antitoxin system HicB family antitoxin [bacterium]|nr:toxin-antitoxin system HicB family antitoxin [bacterium]
MSTLSLRLPESVHNQLRELARKDGVSINQFINSAVSEKVASMLTVDYLEQRAARGSRQEFERVFRGVPDTEPSPEDRIAPQNKRLHADANAGSRPSRR